VHDSPPFSTAGRLRDPTLLDRLGDRLLEVRLLAVRPEARHGSVFAGLGWMLCEHALAAGHSHLLIAGLLERRRLYERLGFRDLGPPVRSGQAWYVPMASPVAAMPRRITEDIARMRRKTGTNGPSGVGVPSFAAPQRQDDRCVSFLRN
jgi:hypothetical protein